MEAMEVGRIAAQIACGLLWIDLIRRVRRGGTTWNDHLVAVVATAAGAWAWVPPWPTWAWPIQAWATAAMWALFRRLDLNQPPPRWERIALLWPSQVAFGAAFWGWPLLGATSTLGLLVGIYTGDLSAVPTVTPWLWGGLPLLLAIWGVAHTLRGPKIRRFRVPGLPIRVAQLSDLHASALTHRAEIADLVRAVNALRPDLVVITGDQLMPFSERDHAWMIEELRRLDAPVRLCPGNHDLPVLRDLQAECRAAGMPMLVDEQEILTLRGAPVEIVGVNFWWRDLDAHLQRALSLPPPPPDAFRVLLAHDPRVGARLPADRFDLVLSGHTHGGQLGMEMFGIGWSPLGALGVRDHGWFPVGGRAGVHYVHAGSWQMAMPPRMGVAPEIAVFE